MSKVETIRAKYPKMRVTTFNLFVQADVTKTHKYLEYMCYMRTNHAISSRVLIQNVHKFHELLNYIDNKDIYSPVYRDIQNFLDVVNKASKEKEEIDFQKDIEKKVKVLVNDGTTFMCRPLTYEASMKYGASTRWCTASNSTDAHFKSYTRDGYLVYIMSKKTNLHKNYQKIAFYMSNHFCPIEQSISVFNAADSEIEMSHCVNNGWDIIELSQLLNTFRMEAYDIWYYETFRKKVEADIKKLETINIVELYKNMQVLKEKYADEMSDGQLILSNFINTIKGEFSKYE